MHILSDHSCVHDNVQRMKCNNENAPHCGKWRRKKLSELSIFSEESFYGSLVGVNMSAWLSPSNTLSQDDSISFKWVAAFTAGKREEV